MVIGNTWKRCLNTLLVASLFLGLALSLTTGVDAKKVVQTMSNADCASLQVSFDYYSSKAGDASNNGDTAGAQENTQKAAGFIAKARAGGCGWPGATFPDNTR